MKNDTLRNKIFNLDNLLKEVAVWKFLGKKIVFTNGCFDIMHLGHVDYLSKAADLGDVLIVATNADSSVRKLKGPSRPINDEVSRSKILASLFFVNAVILFEEDTPYNLIKAIKPDVLVKGADWKKEDIVGYDIVIANGGRVETIQFVEGYSTTAIEKRIKGDQ